MPASVATSTECGDPHAIGGLGTGQHAQHINLSAWAVPIPAKDWFLRTADYAADPKHYLISRLGQENFEKHQHLFCITNTYDKDIYGANGHKSEFEKSIASFFGKAHGLFFLTGVQAQMAALKIHCDRAAIPRVAWHVSSHLETAEEKSYKTLYGLERTLIGSDPRVLPTVDEILDCARGRPAAILLEIPNRMLGCSTYTFEQLEQISAGCREHGVALHMDGARFWDIEPFYNTTAGKSFKDIAKLFDTIYLSFYKGLGSVAGAMLFTNDERDFSDAKMWQRRAGGNSVTLIYETIDCERGFNEKIGTFAQKWKRMQAIVSAIREATRSFGIIEFWPEEPICCQVRTIFNGYTLEELNAARDRTEHKSGIRVFDRLWPKYSLDEVLAADRAGKSTVELYGNRDDKRHELEWLISEANEHVDTAVFVKGYVTLCQELKTA